MKKYLDETLSAEERAEALTDEMTTEEQASQLRYDAPAVPGSVKDCIRRCYHVLPGYRSCGYVR